MKKIYSLQGQRYKEYFEIASANTKKVHKYFTVDVVDYVNSVHSLQGVCKNCTGVVQKLRIIIKKKIKII